jgi:DNA-directed RNA polymerase subunit RPC12/RpoP
LVVFGVNPPKGWDHPPVHKTDYNCWTCGVFHGGARRKLSKADFERGWRIVEQGQTVLSVACPDCAATTQPASAPGKPKPVGAPLMGARPVTAPKPKKKGARRR